MDFFGESYTNIIIIVIVLLVAYFVYSYFVKSKQSENDEYFDTMQQEDGDNFETNEEFENPGDEEGFEDHED
jgi:carbon starvation protein CstA